MKYDQNLKKLREKADPYLVTPSKAADFPPISSRSFPTVILDGYPKIIIYK